MNYFYGFGYTGIEVSNMTNTVQIPNDQMIFSVQELKDKGFSYYKINQMVDKGILIKLNKKYYENVNPSLQGLFRERQNIQDAVCAFIAGLPAEALVQLS